MSGKGESFGTCIDTNREEVVYALMALDTELNQLHRLCIEQGPFFKALFHEVTSDALRQGLKQRIPRQPENESHFETSYWKPTITGRQIDNIEYTIGEFRWQWTQVYNKAQSDIFHPQPADAPTPLSVLNTQILKLTHNIAVICQSLTPHEDVSKKWVVGTAFTTTNTGEPCAASSELSSLLAQLTTTDASHRETFDGHICLTPVPWTHVEGEGHHEHEHEDFLQDDDIQEHEQEDPGFWVLQIRRILREMDMMRYENPCLLQTDLLHMCDLCLKAIARYYRFPSGLPHDLRRINRLYDTLVTLIKPKYTLKMLHKTEYTQDVEKMLRDIVYDLMRLGGLINSPRRLELRAFLNV
jgi:hypothetical protein